MALMFIYLSAMTNEGGGTVSQIGMIKPNISLAPSKTAVEKLNKDTQIQ